ncbi:MAG: PKD domain-containing protein [Planctomycetia bacterium]|nr:PKD domain-containing protein [Planctomycetia bacterium]
MQFSWSEITDSDAPENINYILYMGNDIIGTIPGNQVSTTLNNGTVTYLNGIYTFKSNKDSYTDPNANYSWFVACENADHSEEHYFYTQPQYKGNLELYGGTVTDNSNPSYIAQSGTAIADENGVLEITTSSFYQTTHPINIILEGRVVDSFVLNSITSFPHTLNNGTLNYDPATKLYTYTMRGLSYSAGDSVQWNITAYVDNVSSSEILPSYYFPYDQFVKVVTTVVSEYYQDTNSTKSLLLTQDVSTTLELTTAPRQSTIESSHLLNDDGNIVITTVTTTYEEAIRGDIGIYNKGQLTIADSDINIDSSNLVYLGFDHLHGSTNPDGSITSFYYVREINYQAENSFVTTSDNTIILDSYTDRPTTLLVLVDTYEEAQDNRNVAIAADLMQDGAFKHISGSIIQNAIFDTNPANTTYLTYNKTNELVLAYGEIKYVNSYTYRSNDKGNIATVLQIETEYSDNFIGGQDVALNKITDCYAENQIVYAAQGSGYVDLIGNIIYSDGSSDNEVIMTWTDAANACSATGSETNYAVTFISEDGTRYTHFIEYHTSTTDPDLGSCVYNDANGIYTYTISASKLTHTTHWAWYVSTSETINEVVNGDDTILQATFNWRNTSTGNPYYLYVDGNFVTTIAYDPTKENCSYTMTFGTNQKSRGDIVEWYVKAANGLIDEGAAFSHENDMLTGAKYYFVGWNTKRDGSGTWIYPNSISQKTIQISGFDVVYAIWGSNIVNTLNDTSIKIDSYNNATEDLTPGWTSLREAIQIVLFNEQAKENDDYDYDEARSSIVFELDPNEWEQSSLWAESLGWVSNGSDDYLVKFFPTTMTFAVTLGTLPTITSALNIDVASIENGVYANRKGTSLQMNGSASGGITTITWAHDPDETTDSVYYLYIDGNIVGQLDANIGSTENYSLTLSSGVTGLVYNEDFQYNIVMAKKETAVANPEKYYSFSWKATQDASSYILRINERNPVKIDATTNRYTDTENYRLFYDYAEKTYTYVDKTATTSEIEISYDVIPQFTSVVDESNTVSFLWNETNDVSKYHLFYTNGETPTEVFVSGNSYSFNSLEPIGTAYSWYVISQKEITAQETTTRISWNSISDAASYIITLYDSNNNITCSEPVSSTSITFTSEALTPGHVYTYEVQPVYKNTANAVISDVTISLNGYTSCDVYINEEKVASNMTGNYTTSFLAGTTYNYRITEANSTPATTSGTAGTAEIGFSTINWTNTSNAAYYEIYIDGNHVETVLAQSSNGTYSGQNGTAYFYNTDSGYSYKINRSTGTVTEYEIVPVLFFQTGTGTADSNGYATINWNAIADAVSYELYINNTLATTVDNATLQYELNNEMKLEANETFTWWVNPVFEATVAANGYVTFNWPAVPGISSYSLAVEGLETLTIDGTTHSTSTGSQQGGKYTYRVQPLANSVTGSVTASEGTQWYRTQTDIEITKTIDKYVYNVNTDEYEKTTTTETISKTTSLELTVDNLYALYGNNGKTTTTVEKIQTGQGDDYEIVTIKTNNKRTNVVPISGVTSITPESTSRIMVISAGSNESSVDNPVFINGLDFTNGGIFNSEANTGRDGGAIAILNMDSYVFVENAVFTNNKGKYGGSINNWGHLTVHDCVFTDTFETQYDGNGHLVLSTEGFYYNAHYGGALYNVGTMSVINTTIENMRVTGTGGGIANCYTTYTPFLSKETALGVLTVSGSVIEYCSAVLNPEYEWYSEQHYGYGGGISNWGTATIKDNSRITNCYAAENGGGITNGYYLSAYNTQSSMLITNSFISNNTAGYFGGGLINGSVLTLEGASVTKNKAILRNGGGIANTKYDDPSEYLRDGSVDVSEWTDRKGAGVLNILSYNDKESQINENIAVNGSGGGISDWGESINIALNTFISLNVAKKYGGGIITTHEIDTSGFVGFAHVGKASTNSAEEFPATNDIYRLNVDIRSQSINSLQLVSQAAPGSEILVNSQALNEVKTISATELVLPQDLGLTVGENKLLVMLRDADGTLTEPYMLTIVVDDVAPIVLVDKTTYADSRLLKFDLSLDSTASPLNWVIDWGDGQTSTSQSNAQNLSSLHFYEEAGTYNVILELTNNNGTTLRVLLATHEVVMPLINSSTEVTASVVSTSEKVDVLTVIDDTTDVSDSAIPLLVDVNGSNIDLDNATEMIPVFDPMMSVRQTFSYAIPESMICVNDFLSNTDLKSEAITELLANDLVIDDVLNDFDWIENESNLDSDTWFPSEESKDLFDLETLLLETIQDTI